MKLASRRGVHTVAGSLACLLLPLAAVAGGGTPATADPSDAADYDPITTAKVVADGGDVTPGTSDLTTAKIRINPILGDVTVEAALATPPATYVRRAVIALGVTDAGGTCQPVAEIAASNATTNLVVRRPGETTRPAEGSGGGDIDAYLQNDTPLAEGLVPDCGTFRLTSTTGAVLDTAELTFAQTPIRQVTLTAWGPRGLQQQPLNRTRTLDVYVRTDRRYGDWPWWAYDGSVTVDAPAGVRVQLVDGDDNYCYGDPEPTFTGSAASFCFDVKVTRPGVHTVAFRFDAGNADPITLEILVYAPGGPPPPATGDLTGRHHVLFEEFGIVEQYSFGERSSIWFLDRHFAYVGSPLHGRPTCTAAKVDPTKFYGCQRYWWDKAHNVLQVGKWRGSVHARRIDYVNDQQTNKSYRIPFGLAPRGKRLAGTWRYQSGFDSLTRARLRLTRDGRFELAVNQRTSRGRYAVGAAGRLRLTFNSGRTQVHTLGIGKNRAGRLDPATGVLLSLPNFNKGEVAWLTPPKR
ncbi:hypothetical protein [Nocardioides speluncae]|uniref:hypothetical protein n=1 Tax=Nocardioides speluncae TaxID=2670337 RepID=UPI000D699E79|nr:hypothetical protein [Nocardioides speluncae]